MARHRFTCIPDFFNDLDQQMLSLLPMDALHTYGLVSRHYNRNGSIVNVADMDNSVNDGELAWIDDRNSCVWFHRISNIRIDNKNNNYNRRRMSISQLVNAVTVMWAKRANTWRQQYQEVSQLNLYEWQSNIMSRYQEVELKTIDFDHSLIEGAEFKENQLSKESILLRINYEILINSNFCDDVLNCDSDNC